MGLNHTALRQISDSVSFCAEEIISAQCGTVDETEFAPIQDQAFCKEQQVGAN